VIAADQDNKSILAVQAFIDRDTDERIMAICSELQKVEGYNSDLGGQFIPHITLASWRVTPQELQLAESQFESRLCGLDRIQVRVSLEESQEHAGRLGYYLLPEVSESLLQFHAQVHHQLGWRFEPFRKIDLPGSWWPHLTLLSIPETQKPLISQSLQKLREISAVAIKRIGLVSFLGPTRVVSEVKLKRPSSGR
jgi:2'-5' RNA ligase